MAEDAQSEISGFATRDDQRQALSKTASGLRPDDDNPVVWRFFELVAP